MARLDEVNLDEFDFDSPDEPVVRHGSTKMSKKLVVSFNKYGEDKFEAIFGSIATSMKNNPNFPEPWWDDPTETPTSTSLATDKATYSGLKTDATDGDKGSISARITARENATADLKKLARYIELTANGDDAMLESTGYELTKAPGPRTTLPPPAPLDLRLKKGDLEGEIVARCKAVTGCKTYETQICTGDTGTPANWKSGPVTSTCSRIVFTGLTPGVLYHVRIRAINKNGPGAWSDVASLRAD